MRTLPVRRVMLAALATLVTLSVVGPVDARAPVRKIEPRVMRPYRVGRALTPNTDVLSVSGYAAWMIDEALGRVTRLPRLGSAFARAEREEGINARYLVAHAMLESGWGTSAIARYKHNLFGYGAYDRGPWKYALRFRTYPAGIAAVAKRIHDDYLTAGGRWWYGFTTLRGINRYYASDPRWAAKIAVLANILDGLVVTLRERGLRFSHPALTSEPTVGASVALDVPWRAKRGAVLPKAIRFVARWTPVAIVEGGASAPATVASPQWVAARRTDRPGHTARLSLRAPALPGVWRLEVEARDSDGRPLPATDNPRIPSLTVRVASAREARVGLSVNRDGSLAATVRNVGRLPIAAVDAATPTILEAWALPLDPKRDAYRLAAAPLRAPLATGRAWVVRLAVPATPSVVTVRLAGSIAAVGSSPPTVTLVTPGVDGRPALADLPVASPRDDALLKRIPSPGRIELSPAAEPGTVAASVTGGPSAPVLDPAVAGIEATPGRPWLLVRSIAADVSRPASPSQALIELPREPPTPASVEVTGLPAGVRLVLAAIVPPDGTPADPRTLRMAWIPVGAASDAEAAPH